MPVQTQMSSFAKKLGARVAQANAEHKDKPVDMGMQRLPAGIKNGIAKLSSMYTKEYDDEKTGLKGQVFFRASAVVVSPEEHAGQKVSGQVTSLIIPLCDVPAKGQRKAKSFTDNWYEFQNVFKLLGVAPCPETPQTDPTGQKTEAYFFAAMKTLTSPQRVTYIKFATRGWTPPPTQLQPKPTEMVFEEWQGLAEWNGQHNPVAGIADSTQPSPNTAPPEPATQSQQRAAPSPTTGPNPQYQPGGEPDPVDVIASLVEAAMADPEGLTEEGAAVCAKLEELAWAAGATKEQTKLANDWAQVGEMALGILPPPPVPEVTPPTASLPTVGSKWKFAKRTKEGERLKNAKGEPFPPQEVEVTSVDAAAKTCIVKATKDGKTVVDFRKQPIAVKFEWLE